MSESSLIRFAVCVTAVLGLACGGTESQSPAPISTAAADATAPGQAARAAALMSEIRSAGEECESVTRTFLQGEREGGSVWNAECSNGRSYGVHSKPDGSTQVLECNAMETVTGAKCFTKF
jgi:hypothetical protein